MHLQIQSNLHFHMQKRGITVRELADLAKVSVETVMRARDQRIGSCKLETLVALATVLQVEVNDLFLMPKDGE